MLTLGKEATDFVRACKAIHALLDRGGTLTPGDEALIEFSTIELLSKMSVLASSFCRPSPHYS
jgi:hypothetical protein